MMTLIRSFKILITFSLIFVLNQNVNAQNWTIAVCSSGPPSSSVSSNYGPMNSVATANATSRTAVIYPASQLTGILNNTLSAAYFNRSLTVAMLGTPNFKIYLKNVSNVDWGASAITWDTEIAGATLVYDGNPVSIVGNTAGWKSFPFSTNFTYTNQNLAVFFEYKNTTASNAITWSYEFTSPCATTTNSNTTKYSNNTTGTLSATLASTDYRRPYIGFDVLCTAPPTPGTAVLTSTTSCLNGNITLDVVGVQAAQGLSYQWQSSPTIGGTYTNVGTSQTTTSKTTTLTASAFYRVAVTCNSQTAYSTPVEVIAYTPLNGVYTLNPTLPNSTTNFQSLNKLNLALGCGVAGPVVVNFSPGTYKGNLNFNAVTGTSATNTITIKGNGAKITDSLIASSQDYILQIRGTNYVTIDSMIIEQNVNSTKGYVVSMGAANFNKIKNCQIIGNQTATGTTFGGIVISGSTTSATTATTALNNIFENNQISGGYYGIAVTGTTATKNVNRNEFIGNTIRDFYFYGIYISAGDSSQIVNNNIHRLNRASISTAHGIYFQTNSKKSLVRNNIIHDLVPLSGTVATNGINFSSNDAPVGQENIVVNNVIYGIVGASGINYGIINTGSDGVYAYYNTIVMENTTSTAGVAYGMYQTTDATNLKFINNNIYVNKTGSGVKMGLAFAATASAITSNYNNIYVATGLSHYVGGYGTLSTAANQKATLADWKTVNSSLFDQNSISTDPQFVSPSTGNYKPSSIAFNDAGTPLAGFTTDVAGVTRHATTPDIGAYEYTLNLNDAGITNLISPNTPCPGMVDVTVRLKNYASVSMAGVTINWTLNGVAQAPYVYTGPLAAGLSVDLPIGSFTLNTATSNTINVWTSLPNDGNLTNDTLKVSNVKSKLNGTYTIGGVGAYYPNLTSAINELSTLGICGPVEFKVATGTYNEQIVINPVPGASEINTIRFVGNNSTIQYLNTTTTNRYIIKINGADHIILDSLIIKSPLESSTSTYGWGIHFGTGSDSNIVRNCKIYVSDASTGTTNYAGILFSNSTSSLVTAGTYQYNLIENNFVSGGYVGIQMYSTADLSKGNSFLKNKIINPYNVGIRLSATDSSFVMGNEISRPSAPITGTFDGIEILGTSSTNVMVIGNKIHTFAGSTLTNTSAVVGITFTSTDATVGKENIVANNVIYDFNNLGSHQGMANTGSDGVHYYNNSISIENQESSTSVAYGIYQSTAASNIILRNNSIKITKASTGNKIGLAFNTNTSTISSDKNDIYVSGSSAAFIGAWGAVGTAANQSATLADWNVASAFSFDLGSTVMDPMYNSTNNLIPQAGSPLIAAGQAVPIINTDIEGNIRNGSNPYIGAYEISGDYTGPNITFTPISAVLVSATTPLINFATITDPSTVDVSTINRPRLYFKKSTENNTYVGNTSTDNGWKYVSSTSTTSPFSFTIDYSLLTSAPVLNDKIDYFVVAQDINGNVSVNGSVSILEYPISVALQANNFPVSGQNNYNIGSAISGNIEVGAGKTYTSLSGTNGAFDALNKGVLSGNVILTVTSNLTETGAVGLNQLTETGVSNYTISIVPNGDTLRTISGGYAGGLIRLNGADRVTINGSGSNNGKYLKIINSSSVTASAAIQLISYGVDAGCENVIIKNSIIAAGTFGSPTILTYGIYVGSPVIKPFGNGFSNHNLIIENDSIYRAHQAIYIAGSSVALNNNVKIMNNVLGSAEPANYLYFAGVNALFSDRLIIKKNQIMNARTSGTAFSEYNNPRGVYINEGVTNARITQNNITGMMYTSASGYGARGIHVNTKVLNSKDTIDNNMIGNISGDGWDLGNNARDLIAGLMIQGENTGGLSIWYNSVSLTGNANNSDAGIHHISAALFIDTNVTGLDIRNNTFSNAIVNIANATAKSYSVYIRDPATTYSIFNYNNLYVSGTQGVLAHATIDLLTLNDIKANTLTNNNSINVNPNHLSTSDLHSQGTALYQKGSSISSVNYDIEGDIRGATPCIGADEFLPPLDELVTEKILYPKEFICGTTIDSVTVVITNFGRSPQTGFMVKVDVNGAFTTTGSKLYTKILGPSSSDTVNVIYNSNIDTGIINISAYTDLLNDFDRKNDTTKITTKVLAIPSPPTLVNVNRACFGSPATVVVSSNVPNILWYATPTSMDVLMNNDTLTTPPINGPTTFYAASSNSTKTLKSTGLLTKSASPTSGIGTTDFGLVFDVLSPFTLQSVTVYPVAASAGVVGTIAVDIVNASGALVHTASATVVGNPAASATAQVITLNFNLLPGTNYKMRPTRGTGITGLLFEPSASAPSGNYGYPFVIPGKLSINTSTLTAAPTNTARNDLYYYFYDWKVSVNVLGCESSRIPVTVVPISGPTGSIMSKSFPYNGVYINGTKNSPDESCVGDTLTYVVSPPTGLLSADLGTTWSVSNQEIKSSNGIATFGSININGATLQYITAPDDKDSVILFSAKVRNIVTGCDSIIKRYLKVSNTLQVNLGADRTICNGSSVVLDAGNTGSKYLWSNGDTTKTITVNTAGAYFVTVTNSSGCAASDQVVINVIQNPSVNLGTDQTHCAGSQVVLDAGLIAGASYLWSTGETSPSIFVNTSGTYIVNVSILGGCVASDTITVTMVAPPDVNLGAAQLICSSDTITLDAGNNGASYLWSTGDTTQTIKVSYAATYSVKVTDKTTGCYAIGIVTVTNHPIPNSAFSIAAAVGQSISFQSNATNVTYKWDFGDPASPSNTSALPNPTHFFTSGGSYNVTLTVTYVSTGCSTTSTQTIAVTGLNNKNAEIFKLGAVPNPFIEKTKIKYSLPSNAENVSVEVFDLIGRKVADVINNEQQVAGQYQFEFNNIDQQVSSGVYIVKLTVDGQIAYTRIVDIAKK